MAERQQAKLQETHNNVRSQDADGHGMSAHVVEAQEEEKQPDERLIDIGDDEGQCTDCIATSASCSTSPECDSFASAFVALACIAGMPIYTSPLFDWKIMFNFTFAKWWGGWYLLTNVANLSQCLHIIPGYMIDRYGPVPVFRVCAFLSLLFYAVGGGWEYLAMPGDMPYGMILLCALVIGVCSSGLVLSAVRLMGDSLTTDSALKARVYGAMLVAKASGCITYASMTTVLLEGPISEQDFGDSLPYVGRLPFALATVLLSYGLVVPPKSAAGKIDSMMSKAFAGSVDTYRALWWPAALLTFLTFLNPHSLLPFFYETWMNGYTTASWFHHDANHIIPESVLYFEFGVLAIAIGYAFRRWCRGAGEAKLSPARTVDASFSEACASSRLWTLFASVAVVAGSASVVFNDTREMTSDWYGGTSGYLDDHYTPTLTVGVLIGCFVTAWLYEKLVACGARKRAAGVLTWMSCWSVALGFVILLTMGHACPYKGSCEEHTSNRRGLLVRPGSVFWHENAGGWPTESVGASRRLLPEAVPEAVFVSNGAEREQNEAAVRWPTEAAAHAGSDTPHRDAAATLPGSAVAQDAVKHHHHDSDDGDDGDDGDDDGSPTPSPTDEGYVHGYATYSMWLYLVALLLIGIGYGGMTMLVPVVVDEWFGVSCFGTLVGVIMLGAAVGHLLFVNLIAYHYVNECSNDMTEQCFKPTFKWCTFACLLVAPLQAVVDFQSDAMKRGA